jgi:uncharacterized membrane protein YcaP (DUF421 family)
MTSQQEQGEWSMRVSTTERRTWRMQRAGWFLMLLVAVAAVATTRGHAIVRPFLIYLMLLVVFRLTGRRSIGEITTFDFILLLVVSEAVSSALLAGDDSLTGALIAVITLVGIDVLLSLAKHRWEWLDRLLEDVPVVLYHDGELQQERMQKERISVDDILESARLSHGLERLDQISSAVLERRGIISIIPRRRPT